MKQRHPLLAGFLFGAGATVIAGAAIATFGIRLNVTPSMPPGLWIKTNAAAVQRGEIVFVCLPDTPQTRRYAGPSIACGSGIAPVLKEIGGVPGDTVTVSASGISINGHPIDHTTPLTRDGEGRAIKPFPPGTYHLKPGEVWLVSTAVPNAFDSRYFGPVPSSGIISAARPLWVADK